MLSESSEERIRVLLSHTFFCFSRQRKRAAVEYRVKIEVDRGCYRQWKEDGEKTAGEEKEGHRGGPDNRPSIGGIRENRMPSVKLCHNRDTAKYEYSK